MAKNIDEKVRAFIRFQFKKLAPEIARMAEKLEKVRNSERKRKEFEELDKHF